MAMQQLTGAPKRANRRTTSPLPPAAADALVRLEVALITPDPVVVAKVNAALGYQSNWIPRAYLGETATYRTVWSQVELNDLYLRVGGTVTARQVERSTHGGESTWTATEITLTVQVPEVGAVKIVTDLEDDPEQGYPTDLPIVALARYRAAAVHYRELAEAGDYEGCEYVRDEMTMCRCQLAAAGRLDLIEVA
ncbi:hypothetical protein ACWERY_02215 [Streptomyces sp. NPDC004082]